MARQWDLFFGAVQPILKQIFMWKYSQKLTAFFLALLTLILTFVIPAFFPEKVKGTETEIKPTSLLISQVSNALDLEQQGKQEYDIGRFSKAAEFWQKAANAYGKDEEGKNRNLINKAKALQSLGLYPETCTQLLQVFDIVNLECNQLSNKNKNIENTIRQNIQAKPNSINTIIGLRLLGETLQKFGQLELSKTLLNISLTAAKEYPEEKSALSLSLGNLERTMGNKERDKLNYYSQIDTILSNKCGNEFNKDDLDKQKLQDLDYRIKCVNNESLTSYKQAFKHYAQSDTYYQQVANINTQPITQVQAELNQLSLLLDMKEWWDEQIDKNKKYDWPELKKYLNNKVEYLLNPINSHLSNLSQSIDTSREIVYAQINFANSLIRLKNNTQSKIAEIFLSKAIQQARKFEDKQAEAVALSNLARLYEPQIPPTENLPEKLTEQDKLDLAKAKKLTEQALILLNDINVDNRQILYRQRHQLGRILKTSGKNMEGALASYAEAWNMLQSLRADLVTSVDNQFSFRQNVEPVYREFIDLLLETERSKIQVDFKKLVLLNNTTTGYSSGKDENGKNILHNPLNMARLVMESLQLAELDNFFQEPCSPPLDKLVQIENIDENAAVIYPIILENRLEVILFQKNKQPYRNSYQVTKADVNTTIKKLADLIYTQTSKDGTISALTLLEDSATTKDKLNDNKKEVLYLSQEVYKWLIKPLEENHKLDQKQVKTLVFVLDRSFQKIPLAALYDGKNYLIEKYNIALSVGQQLKEPKQLELENIEILAGGVSKQVSVEKKNLPGLTNVNKELENIKKLNVRVRVSPTILCDNEELCGQQKFTKKNFEAKMKSSPTVVHLATHGFFSSNREQTFIVTGDTGDNTIKIDDFQNLLNPQGKNRNKNIELLVLSACQTASGDDKAVLGMAGVALRSGASSTIASLWPVSDQATTELMKQFYLNLTNPNEKMSRAKALRNAQISLITNDEYNHPIYWAAFTLVGNWL